MQPAFWTGKKVLVTGHTGFKGTWLCLWLERLGAGVTGYALEAPTQPNLFEPSGIAGRIRSIRADVRDLPRLQQAFEETKPEIVFHMAAQSLVGVSYGEPVQTYSTNVMGTVHVLEAMRQTPSVRAAVIVTSDKCYENRGSTRGYREDEPMGGASPYSSSKGCAELAVSAYRTSYFNSPQTGAAPVGLASARAGNVIGGGDWARDRLVPDFVRAASENRPLEVRCPDATRPWQHVLEPLSGYVLLAERLWESPAQHSQAWNFGPDEADARPVRYVAERLATLWGEGASWRSLPDAPFREDHYLKLDCSKARGALGWRPRTDLDTALRWVVDWHKRFQAGADPVDLCLERIERFTALGD